MNTVRLAVLCAAVSGVLALTLTPGSSIPASVKADAQGAPGELLILGKEGQVAGACPLKNTDVSAAISGFVARVSVVQQFHNPTDEKIEAVYTFPLPEDSAVDNMEMKVGSRTIVGEIHRREEAREIYEAAKAAGHVAALLDQERPNIFTQAVANIMPGEQVTVTISYVQMLKYEAGEYEFVFPMVVGPRYIPGSPTGSSAGTGREPDTDEVPDASRITPPITPRGTRAGHDISLSVDIDTFIPIQSIDSKLHEVEYSNPNERTLRVALKNKQTIPNKDFVLRYSQAGEAVQSGVIAYAPGTSGYFALAVQPPKNVKPKFVTPKEMIFVLDTSGSQHGEPLKKSRETIFHCIKNMNPGDTFNLIAFSDSPRTLFERAQPFNPANESKALKYIDQCEARGGTEIIPALKPALQTPADPNRLRIVVVFTDGYVGNDFAILDFLQKNLGPARVFCFGIGNGVNRFLIEKMAQIGRGASDFVLLNSDGEKIAAKFYDRIRNPIVTDISIDWNGLPVVVEETYPARLPDLFEAQPLIVKGCFSAPASGELVVRGKVAGKPWAQRVAVEFPERQPENDAIAPIWARAKIDDLMDRDWMGAQTGKPDPEIKEQIVDVALAHRLMTQYTSFVAVEKTVVTSGGEPRTISVPVEMPEGVSYEGIFGDMGDGSFGVARQSASGAGYGGAHLAYSPAPLTLGRPAVVAKSGSVTMATDVDGAEEKGEPAELTPEQKKQMLIDQRLDKALKDLLEKYRKSGEASSYPVPGKLMVKDGRVEVMMWIKDASAEKLDQLEKLGLVDRTWALQDRIILGWIPLAKLEEFAQLDFVTRIAAPDYSEGK